MAIYSTYLTNKFGFRLKNAKTRDEKILLREEYVEALFSKLRIDVNVINKELLPQDGKYLLISNHRSIIDPLIIERAFLNTEIKGYWVAKKSYITLSFLVCLQEMRVQFF